MLGIMTNFSDTPSPVLPPQDERYFEDYEVGAVYEYGPVETDAAEVVAFAAAYDPQPMHTDAVLAAKGPYGGLILSGWHTIGLLMRLYVGQYLSTVASLVSPGCDEIRWKRPVRPGEKLILRVTVLETRRQRSNPMQGSVKALIEGLNADGVTVASFQGTTFMKCRAPADGAAPAQ